MRASPVFPILFMAIWIATCTPDSTVREEVTPYQEAGRYTQPLDLAVMLDSLPREVTAICDLANQQTVHHNLLPFFEVPPNEWSTINRIWPYGAPFPGLQAMLAGLRQQAPHNLYLPRPVRQRLIGGCIIESVLLTGMLRHRRIPARIRAGYFQNTMSDSTHILHFWEAVSRAKGIERELLRENPAVWKAAMHRLTRRSQIAVDKHIEHWICEYWDDVAQRWRLVDANNTFLKASSNIEVGFHLPDRHFEYAHHAWRSMRAAADFNPVQYAEWPQDGRSHIRSQLLFDFYNLLNHELAGYDDRSGAAYAFVKGQSYQDTTPEELQELDLLAALLAGQPEIAELVGFYFSSNHLRLRSAERDTLSFVFDETGDGSRP